ncbi:MAG: hypothetical protein WAK34_13460, partial [Rhodoplanes sp.]
GRTRYFNRLQSFVTTQSIMRSDLSDARTTGLWPSVLMQIKAEFQVFFLTATREFPYQSTVAN